MMETGRIYDFFFLRLQFRDRNTNTHARANTVHQNPKLFKNRTVRAPKINSGTKISVRKGIM